MPIRAPERLICNPNAIGAPHWAPIGPTLATCAANPANPADLCWFFWRSKALRARFFKICHQFCIQNSEIRAQILFKINFFNIMFKDWCEIRKFEKRRKNTGFSMVFLGFQRIDRIKRILNS